MDWFFKLCFAAFFTAAAAIGTTHGLTIISGTVFCDQCKDGKVSLFDYPVYGIKVAMACPDGNGQMTTRGEEATNWLGGFNMRFDGTQDLSNCFVQVSGSSQPSATCGAGGGPAKPLKLMLRMFDMEMYAVEPLISQPAQPMSFCPSSSVPAPVTPSPVTPALPPLPSLPPMPPSPFLEASACPYQKWIMPEYRCYWKVLSPDAKVGVVFGLLAARKYGTDMTLWEGMTGRGEPYRTLLREGTTALLNSYNTLLFPFHPLGVVERMNWALMGSTQQVLHTALSFMRANSGISQPTSTCRFTSCTTNS